MPGQEDGLAGSWVKLPVIEAQMEISQRLSSGVGWVNEAYDVTPVPNEKLDHEQYSVVSFVLERAG